MRCELGSRVGFKGTLALGVVCLLLTGCGIFSSVAPKVVLVPALTINHEPYQLAEDIRAYVFVELEDGTTVRSKNRVKIRAGTWCDEVEPLKHPPG